MEVHILYVGDNDNGANNYALSFANKLVTKCLCQWFCFTQSTNWVGASRKVVAGTKEIWKKIQCRLRPAQCMGSPMQCARLYGAKIDGDEELRRSIDTNTRRASIAGPAPPLPNPAPHGEHHITAKMTLMIESPLDLWTVSKRFRTNCYLVATSLEKGSKCNFNKKRDEGQGLYRFRNILCVGRFTPSTVHPTLSNQSSQGQNIFRNIHLFPSHH